MRKHTPGPLTYEIGDYSGENWPIASIQYWDVENGQMRDATITTDHVHASELVNGDMEADLRLWTASPGLLGGCKLAKIALSNLVEMNILTRTEYRQETLEIVQKLDAIIARAELED